MRFPAAGIVLLTLMAAAVPCFGQENTRKADVIVEDMAVKLVRGVTNIATCVVELPKQSYLSVKRDGAVGYVVGPLKGVGMTVYRGFIGAVETAFFLVPQPGFYDEMVDPEFVWKGWKTETERVQVLN